MRSHILNAGLGTRRHAPHGARTGADLVARAWALCRTLLPARRVRSRSEEAAEVREMARRIQHSEPGFASDLLAAADRHDRLADDLG